MTAWILTCNPERFDIHALRRAGEDLDSWTVRVHLNDMVDGEPFALWVTGTNAGIIAIGHLIDSPIQIPPPTTNDPHWKVNSEAEWAVPVQVDSWLDNPVPKASLQGDQRLREAKILRQPFAANPLRLTDNELEAITELANTEPRIPPPPAVTSPVEPPLTWQEADQRALQHMKEVLEFADATLHDPGPDGGVDVSSKNAAAQVKYHINKVGFPYVAQIKGVAVTSGRIPVFYSRAGYIASAFTFASKSGVALFAWQDGGSPAPCNAAASALLRKRRSVRRKVAKFAGRIGPDRQH